MAVAVLLCLPFAVADNKTALVNRTNNAAVTAPPLPFAVADNKTALGNRTNNAAVTAPPPRPYHTPRAALEAHLAAQRAALARLAPTRRFRDFMLRRDPGDPNTTKCVRNLFVTGPAGAGTHYVARFLGAMKVLGSVGHEGENAESDGLVSWAGRHSASLGLPQAQYAKFHLDASTSNVSDHGRGASMRKVRFPPRFHAYPC